MNNEIILSDAFEEHVIASGQSLNDGVTFVSAWAKNPLPASTDDLDL